jgi:sigma-B regulation protein RsbQ
MNITRRNNIRKFGNGNQTMIFAHGFGCDQNVWRHLIKAFETEYTILAFDYVGAGQSDLSFYDPVRYGSLKGYARDLLEICEAFQITNAILIAHSVSSMIGMLAAIENPSAFSRLIFVAPSPCYINDQDYVGGLEKADLESLLDMMDNNYLGWSGTMAPMVMGNAEQPELAEELSNSFCATDPDIARQFARVTFLSDNRSDLKKLKVQSLTLQCSQDMLAPLGIGHYLEEHVPGNTLKVMEATGHCPHLSAPQETINLIRSYLNQQESHD